MATPRPFEEVRDAIRDEINWATDTQQLIDVLVRPLRSQPKLLDRFPALLDTLYLTVTSSLVMTLCRLFEADEDPRKASLITFLAGVGRLPCSPDVAERLVRRREEYARQIPAFRDEITATEKALQWYRNAYLAHNDLTKRARVEVKWEEVRAFLGTAQLIMKGYYHAHEESDYRFGTVNFRHEPKDFLAWTRLDDYETHLRDR